MLNSFRVEIQDETPHSIEKTLITNEDDYELGKNKQIFKKKSHSKHRTDKSPLRVNKNATKFTQKQLKKGYIDHDDDFDQIDESHGTSINHQDSQSRS